MYKCNRNYQPKQYEGDFYTYTLHIILLRLMWCAVKLSTKWGIYIFADVYLTVMPAYDSPNGKWFKDKSNMTV